MGVTKQEVVDFMQKFLNGSMTIINHGCRQLCTKTWLKTAKIIKIYIDGVTLIVELEWSINESGNDYLPSGWIGAEPTKYPITLGHFTIGNNFETSMSLDCEESNITYTFRVA